jgi:hypothetical protein
MNGNVAGVRVFTTVTKLKISRRDQPGFGENPNEMTDVSIIEKRRIFETLQDTMGRRRGGHVKTVKEMGVSLQQANGH